MARETVLYIMVGIPGSGKTYVAQNSLMRVDPRHTVHVSRDEIRKSLLAKDESYFDRETEVFRRFVKEINFHLGSGKSVIADATHVSQKSRAKLLKNIPLHKGFNIVFVVCDTPLQICNERNQCREGFERVPEKAILDMSARFTKPTKEEMAKYAPHVGNILCLTVGR